MSTAIVTLFAIALMLVGVLTWSNASYSSIDSGIQSWKQMVEAAEEVARTDVEITGAQMQAPFVEVLVQNSGKIQLAQFPNWDVLVQYYSGNSTYNISSLVYTGNVIPSDNEWAVATIYSDDSLGQQEVFDPGILSPGEVMLMKLNLNPQPGAGTTNRVTLSTPNGVVAMAQFSG
ncbi:MAG: hypothetical protein JSW38_02750 [Dehalococcoidia bacterium]|nr:MAG: hypothetical protein JSW38_02750 [Dehalococcoidia bacterium]